MGGFESIGALHDMYIYNVIDLAKDNVYICIHVILIIVMK
jgi:hypothetical protein